MAKKQKPAKNLQEAFAKKIKVLLVERQLTQAALAAYIDNGDSYANRILTGKQKMVISDIQAISMFFSVTIRFNNRGVFIENKISEK